MRHLLIAVVMTVTALGFTLAAADLLEDAATSGQEKARPGEGAGSKDCRFGEVQGSYYCPLIATPR